MKRIAFVAALFFASLFGLGSGSVSAGINLPDTAECDPIANIVCVDGNIAGLATSSKNIVHFPVYQGSTLTYIEFPVSYVAYQSGNEYNFQTSQAYEWRLHSSEKYMYVQDTWSGRVLVVIANGGNFPCNYTAYGDLVNICLVNSNGRWLDTPNGPVFHTTWDMLNGYRPKTGSTGYRIKFVNWGQPS